MKYTRYEFVRANKKWLKVIIWLAAIMLLYAVFVKVIISNFIVVPNISGTEGNTDNIKSKYIYKKIEPVKCYIIQMGAFATAENAESFSNRLRLNDIPSYIRKVDNLSIVTTFLSHDERVCMNKSDEIKHMGYDTIIKEFNISPEDMPESLKNNDSYIVLNKIMNDTCDAVKIFMEIADNDELSDADFSSIKNILNDLDISIAQSINLIGINKAETKELFEDVLKKFDDSITSISSKMMKSDDEGKTLNIMIEETMLELFYSFNDFVEQTNQCIDGNSQ